jgi:Domain of unknown function (DUF4157)
MSDIGRPKAPPPAPSSAPNEAASSQKVFRSLKPGELGPDRMNPVREERAAANEQIQRSLKAWRSASGGAGAASIPKGAGSPLSSSVRSRMEPKLGASLGNVRVHTGGDSATAAKGFGARAFTVGDDVHFNSGEFQPGTKEGDKLLAHELTHVVQGQNSGIQRKEDKKDEGGGGGGGGKEAGGGGEKGGAEVSDPGEPAEKEADAVGDKVGEELHGGDEKKDGKDAKGGKDAKDGKDAKGGKDKKDDKKGGGEKGDAKGEKKGGGGGEDKKDEGGEAGGGGDGGKKEPGEAKDPKAEEKKEEGGAKGGEKPAPIAAKLEGVGFKVFRDPAKAPSPGQPGQKPEDTISSEQCKTFKQRYAGMCSQLQLPQTEADAEKIWLQVVTQLQATDEAYKAAPTAKPGSPRKDMAADGFKKIMKDFEPITAALSPMMEKFSQGKKVWAFWSGTGACDVAKANSEACLEKSALGHLFDGININGGWDIQMWASLSKAYATHAAKDASSKTYRGFVGRGSSQEASIFNQVEQPQFVSMLNDKEQATLKITWYSVAQDPKNEKQADMTCNGGGFPGTMGSGDRGGMVADAEKKNEQRCEIFKKTGKVVKPEEVDAEFKKLAAGGGAPPPGGKK